MFYQETPIINSLPQLHLFIYILNFRGVTRNLFNPIILFFMCYALNKGLQPKRANH